MRLATHAYACSPPFAQSHAEAAAVFGDEFYAAGFQGFTDGVQVVGDRGAFAALEIGHG